MYRLKGSPSFLNRKTMVQSPLMSAQGYSAQSRCPIISSATLNPDPPKENKICLSALISTLYLISLFHKCKDDLWSYGGCVL